MHPRLSHRAAAAIASTGDRTLNHVYRLVWNRRLRAWQAVSELASQSRAGRASPGAVMRSLPRRHALGVALALGLAWTGTEAQAACNRFGIIVQCSLAADASSPSYTDASNNLLVNVAVGASLGVSIPAGGTALNLTGSNVTVVNNGRIDPNALGANAVASTGLFIGNATASVIRVTNEAMGTLAGVTAGVGGGTSLPSLDGMALVVRNGSGGTSYLSNAGMISSSDVTGRSSAPADKAVIAVYGGGSVEFVNEGSGTIVGRVAFEASGIPGPGHSFTNAGTIVGGVSLGQGGYNTFTAVSGSVVQRGSGTSSGDLWVTGLSGLAFAPAGKIDGGAGGNNTLVLQNVLPSRGTGSGTGGGETSISGLSYVNFQNLRINSGSWILQDRPLVSGGSVTLSGGLATLANGGMLGTGQINANGGAIAAGATAGTFTVDNDFVLGNGGLTVTGANGLTLAGRLSGSGGLALTGTGTVILTGVGGHTGGTSVQSGTLQVGDGANAGSLAGDADIAAGAALVFNRSDAVRFDGILRGTGQLRQAGSGTLVLAGENPFGGTTVIDAGTLQVGDGGNHGSLSGNIVNNASLRFDRADDSVYGGAISGAGATTKLGAGTLALTGDSSAYAGATQVLAGALQVDGKLGGQVQAENGATLSGTGVLGQVTIASGAILAPGTTAASTGRMTVQGNLAFQSGAVYHVAATSDGAASSVRVAGSATLTGATVQVAAAAGNYAENTSYDILHADGTFNGTRFAGTSTDLAYLTPSLSYAANDQDVRLTLTRKQVVDPGSPGTPSKPGSGGTPPSRAIRFADLVSGRNAVATANAVDSMPAGNEVYGHALSLPDGAPQPFFSALSGESHASAIGALQGLGGQARSLPFAHLRANLGAGMRAGAPTAAVGASDVAPASSVLPASSAQPAWAELVGNWQRQGATRDTAEARMHTGGVFAGADGAIGAGWRLGGALGYTDSKLRTEGLDDKTDISSYSAIVYGGKAFEAGAGKLNLLLGAAYTWHDINSKRRIMAGGLDQTLRADYGANTTQLFTELGYALPMGPSFTLEPYAGLAWADLRRRAFQESGGSAALSGASQRNQTTTSTLGLRGGQALGLGKLEGRITAGAGWRHAFGDVNPTSRLAFDAGNAFTVAGAPIARDAALLELGLDAKVGRSATVGLSYAGQFGSGNQDHSATLAWRWAF